MISQNKDYRAYKELKNYMLEVYGDIINSNGEIPQEVIDFLGKPPKFNDLPKWLTEDVNNEVPYVPELSKEQREELYKKLMKQKNQRNERAMVSKMDSGVSSEKGLGYIIKQLVVEQDNQMIQGKYNPISFMIMDCIAHKLCTEDEKCKELIAQRAVSKEDLYTVNEIKAIREELEYEVKVVLTDKEIKETLGLSDRLSNKQIFEAVMDLVEISVTPGEHKYDYDSETRTYYPVHLGGAERFILGVISTTTGRISRRTGYEEHIYVFTFRTELSLTFLKNILNGNIWLKPKELYRMKPGHQNIVNYALPNENAKGFTILSLEELCRLTGIKVQRTNKQQQLVEKYLDDLVKLGIYSRWRKRGRGKKTQYLIFKGSKK